MKEIEENTYSRIQELCAEGDDLVEQGEIPSALKVYWQAFELMPEPKTDWDATTWILTAIGDANFLQDEFNKGIESLSLAMKCPGAIGNPFIHMRLGQCLFEVGNLDSAAEELVRAYALEGDEIFSNDDSKYLEFLKNRIDTSGAQKRPWWKRKKR